MKDLTFYFKCRVGHYKFPINDYVKPKDTRLTRHSSDNDVLIPKCRPKIFQLSNQFKLWNTLPESNRTITSFNQFKPHVLQRYSAAFCTNYDVTNFNTLLTFGCRDGAVVRALASHQCGPSSIPGLGVICGLSLLVLYSAPRGFLHVLRFPLSSKTNI